MGSHDSPKEKVQVNLWLTWTFLVAGAGFEPATSGRHRGRRDHYRQDPEATECLGVVREPPSLPNLRLSDSCRRVPSVSGQ